MGGGLSKKAAASRQKAPPTHVNQFVLPPDDNWEVERVRDDEWQSVPYALLCPPKHPVTPPRAHGPPPLFVPFDTPNGGAGVGSLRQRHLEEVTEGAELSEVPPTALCVEVLEVSGLNDTATPVGARARGPRALLRALRALHVPHALHALPVADGAVLTEWRGRATKSRRWYTVWQSSAPSPGCSTASSQRASTRSDSTGRVRPFRCTTVGRSSLLGSRYRSACS